MLARWRAAGLIIPTVMTLAMLPVLIGLGTWQWQRKAWKEDLIATIEARTTAEPVPYRDAIARSSSPDAITYLRTTVTGAFDHGEERHVYAPRTQGSGWNIYTLFRPVDDLPPLFINRGWVPERLKDPATRVGGQVPPPVTIIGLARLPEVKSAFTPDNDLKGNRWYSRDTDAMRWGAAGPPSPEQLATMRLALYAPFSIDAEAKPETPGGWPRGGTTIVRLANSHLQYAVTWFGLALTLLGVFVVFARQRLAALIEPSLQP